MATKSDTEVILHLYDLHGAECVMTRDVCVHLGLRKQQIFMARPCGKKAADYARTTKHYVGDEIHLCVPEIKPDVRLESIPLYLTYQFIRDGSDFQQYHASAAGTPLT